MSSQPDPNEKTLIVVKPDAVARGYVGEILGRFEKRGMKILQLRAQTMTKAKAEEFGEVEMRAWWHGLQLVDGLEESVIGVEASADAAAARVRKECGLALG